MAGNPTDRKLKSFTHLHSNKLACLNLNPQKSAIGGKTNKSEIRGGSNSFVKERRGTSQGIAPSRVWHEHREKRGKEIPNVIGNKSQKSKEQLHTRFGPYTACVEYIFQSEACPLACDDHFRD